MVLPAADGYPHPFAVMNQWMNDNHPMSNSHAGIGLPNDVSMSFGQNPQTINPAQFQNQAFLNGANRTNSPAFHTPMYQTNSVVPSKRSREDSLGTSPRQAPNVPPGSRSQTPGQAPFPNFNPQANGAPPFTNAPTPFQHLQTSNNATPSPTMQQMGFGGQGGPQRVSTASPNPFSPQHSIPQASPGVSDQNSRVATPHDNPQNFMTNAGFAQGFNPQQFVQGMGGQMNMNQMNMAQQSMMAQGMNPAQRYQMQLQAQARQMAQQQARAANGMVGNPQAPMQQQQPQQQQQQQQQQPPQPQPQINPHEQTNPPQQRIKNTPQDFFRGLQQFAAMKGRPFDMQPQICGRPIDVMRLYQAIFKGGGTLRLTQNNQWPLVAQAMGFPPQQHAQAATEIQQYWFSNVGNYEQMWVTQQQRQRMAAQQQQASPNRENQQGQNAPNHQRTQSELMQMKLNGLTNQNQAGMNGMQAPKEQTDANSQTHRQNLSRQLDSSELNGMQPQAQTQRAEKQTPVATIKTEPETEASMPVKKPIEEPFRPEVIPTSRYHGPINVEEMSILGQHIIEAKPVAPTIRELGVIDIHALIMAIKSGMHAETRNALDILVILSTEPSLQLQLELCDDLVEALVDCAQGEVDFLSQHASEVTDDISLSSYEEITRACHIEAKQLQNVPEFGSLDYDLDRAADRLICITTLLRNFSFYEANFNVLGQSEVLQLLTTVIQHLGTKDMPLRTSRNTLDFMKDVIIFLSNLSQSLVLPGKQEALCVLQFLLAFAPGPSPASVTSDRITFQSYNPNIHKYLPPAVDSLAKLLARDEPNRMYYKAIFHADAQSTPSYELLSKAFGLAVAPIPGSSSQMRGQIETRKPFLLQGMLAAEILAGLAPGSESSLVRSWLQSEDCFAGSLLKIASLLSSVPVPRPPPVQPHARGMPPQQEMDPLAYGAIVNHSMAVLKMLVQKSRLVDGEGNAVLPSTVAMKKETLLGAMVSKDVDPMILRQLCTYAGLED